MLGSGRALTALWSHKLRQKQSLLSASEVCGGRLAADKDRRLLDKEIKGRSSVSDPPPHTSGGVVPVVKEYLAEQSEALKNLTSPHSTRLGVPSTYSAGLSPGLVPMSAVSQIAQGLRSHFPHPRLRQNVTYS